MTKIFEKSSLVVGCVILSNVFVCEEVNLRHCMLCTILQCHVKGNTMCAEDENIP